jgi:hypothetical protein
MNDDLAPAFLKARWLLISIILVILFVDSILICGDILKFGPLIGLLIDVIGASLLAVPDVPILWRQTYSGRLQYAKDTLEQTGAGGFSVLNRPGVDFHSHHNHTGFLEFSDTIESILEEGLGEHTHSTYFVNDDIDLSEIDTVQKTRSGDIALFDDPRDGDRTGYAGCSSGGMVPDTAQFFILTNRVDQRLTSKIAKQKSRIRRAGLGILILGFIQQIIFSI